MIMVEGSKLNIYHTLKVLLLCFGAMPGFKINFYKIEVMVLVYFIATSSKLRTTLIEVVLIPHCFLGDGIV